MCGPRVFLLPPWPAEPPRLPAGCPQDVSVTVGEEKTSRVGRRSLARADATAPVRSAAHPHACKCPLSLAPFNHDLSPSTAPLSPSSLASPFGSYLTLVPDLLFDGAHEITISI